MHAHDTKGETLFNPPYACSGPIFKHLYSVCLLYVYDHNNYHAVTVSRVVWLITFLVLFVVYLFISMKLFLFSMTVCCYSKCSYLLFVVYEHL